MPPDDGVCNGQRSVESDSHRFSGSKEAAGEKGLADRLVNMI